MKNTLDSRGKIKIVTFNYDGIIEYVLNKKWANAEVIGVKYTDVFDIYHAHGYMPIQNDRLNHDQAIETIINWSKEVRVVGEGLTDEVQQRLHEEREVIRESLRQCSDIRALGFAFGKANCELLGFSESTASNSLRKGNVFKSTTMHFLNFDDSYGLRARAMKYCSKDRGGIESSYLVEHRPTRSDFLHLDDAISLGLLGEMPA
jgi:hypothetical protein